MTTLRWTDPAQQDLLAIHDWIAEIDLDAALRVTERIFEAVNGLSAYPHMGRLGRVPGTRELVVDRTPYIVAYRVTGSAIEVLRVRHGARRWPRRV